MLETLKMMITRQRIRATLRREVAARGRVTAERLHLAKLEGILREQEIAVLTNAYLKAEQHVY